MEMLKKVCRKSESSL